MIEKSIYRLSYSILFFIAFLYLALIPIGHWQDEYYTFNDIIASKQHLFSRLLHWSPRPASEFAIFLYGKIVSFSHYQMVTEALLPMWLLLMTALLYPVLHYKKQTSGPAFSQYILFSVALFCLFLTTSPPTEFFYWPLSSFAYMPVIATASFIFGALLFPFQNKNMFRVFVPVFLILCSLCSECGALFSIIFGVTYCLCNIKSFMIPKGLKHQTVWFLSIVSSVLILYLLSQGRLGSPGEVSNPQIGHHVFRAIQFGITQFFSEIIIPYRHDWGQGTRHFYGAILSKFLLCISAYLIFKREKTKENSCRSSQNLLFFGLSCLFCSLSVAIASFYEFGTEGTPRHVTLRQCFIEIGLVALATSFAKRRTVKPALNHSVFLVILLCGAVLIPFSWNANALLKEYSNYPTLYTIQKNNWHSGISSSDNMVFINAPNFNITGSLQLEPGVYKRGDSSNLWLINGMMDYFHKKSVTILDDKQPN